MLDQYLQSRKKAGNNLNIKSNTHILEPGIRNAYSFYKFNN